MKIDNLMKRVVKALDREQESLNERLEKIVSLKRALNGTAPRARAGRRKGWRMSAAARRAISRAQKARWAKMKS